LKDVILSIKKKQYTMFIKTKKNTTEKTNTKSQVFRFCCGCGGVSLIEKGNCYFCGGKFIVKGLKDDLEIRKQYNAKTH